jgi:hypothetical protein
MTINEIREKARKFKRTILFRNLREYVAIAVVVVFFGSTMRTYPPLMRGGAGLCIAGMLYVAYQLYRKSSSKSAGAGLAPASCLDSYRRELERERDNLRSVWSWYLGPMLPGLALIAVAGALSNPGHWRFAWVFVGVYVAAILLVFYFVARLNQHAVRSLQRKIDELDAMQGEH